MMRAEVTSPKFKGHVYFNGDEEAIKTVFGEIFGSEIYRKGLEYLLGIEKPIVVDCGAHVGVASLYFSTADKCTIYALEPGKDSYEALLENIKGKDNIKPLNVALRSLKGESDFRANTKGGVGGNFYQIKGMEIETVKHITIKDFMEEQKVDHIDLLKVDVEGSEYEIFLSQAFKDVENKIDMIVCESHNFPMHHNSIPFILTNYDIEYMPEKNLVTKVTGTLMGETEQFEFDLKENTMFVARRKK